jgi:hypothetical protein
MSDETLISATLVLGWLVVVAMGTAELALAAQVGREYVFSAPGISRTGPRLGQRVTSLRFAHAGGRSSLRRFIAKNRETVLVFMDGIGKDVDSPHVKDVLIPDLLKFAELCGENVRMIVFCSEPCTRIAQLLSEKVVSANLCKSGVAG